ncbi:beta-ketoacyl synthase N-terminal-like domain-containing protein [Kitasatospora sp. NPDC101157]|uniref:beta-ketoacyl synthase N-terminal-like domain-containing protein n=1 Tax=Kitasatospora sp. NPDC101157 TaxID=3364098 RepID=UPI0038008272
MSARTAPESATAPTATTAPVVTGIGVVAPNGLGTEAWWQAVRRGENGIGPITRFDASGYPARLAGEVTGFDDEANVPSRLLPQTDRMTRLALFAAAEALADARIDAASLPDYAAGVVTASSAGGFEFGQRELQALWSKGSSHVSVYQSFAWFYAVNSGQISIRHQFRGPSGVVVSGDAGGLDAVAQARRHVRKGTRLMVSGGVDSALCPWGWTAQLAGGDLSADDRPDAAYRPFAARPGGQVAGEGGALLVLEDARAARARGARVYGAVTGCAAAFDPAGGADALRRAAGNALADAGIGPEQVGAVFADAAALPGADRAEATALRQLFGPHGVPVTAPKTMTGRLAAGSGALDLAGALLALRDQLVPPTVHTTAAPEHTLDLVVGAPRPAALRHVLVLARGRGGFHSACVVSSAG